MTVYRIKNIGKRDIINIYLRTNSIPFIISEAFILWLLYDKFPFYIQLIILLANFYFIGHQYIVSHRIIYQIDICEEDRYIVLHYSVLFRNKKKILFKNLHTECNITKKTNGPKFNMEINFSNKSLPFADILLKKDYVPISKNWTKEQLIEISQKLFEIKEKYPTYKKNVRFSRWKYEWMKVDKFEE